ncbi:DUF397 domain-containing protein [Streptomyces parvulus]|uniref:DUF397 domain-containing protein n=1 Tax=Streptomyces parvulus TaxID=146923 RepID=UPI003451FF9A
MDDQLKWVKSSYSDSEGGNCTEIAHDDAIHIRDSESAPFGPGFPVSPASWSAFIAAVQPGA